MYLLDTNICIYAMKNRYPSLTERLFAVPPEQIVLSAVTVGEMEYGASKSRWGDRTRFRMQLFCSAYTVLPFSERDAVVFGRLRAELAAQGTPIGPYDIMIAAQAVCRGLTVVTHNTGEFARVPGIELEDWTQSAP